MGISISSKQRPKNLDDIDNKNDDSPRMDRGLYRSSSRYLKSSNSDSGYPTTPQTPDNSQRVDRGDVLSIDDLWIPTAQTKTESQNNFFADLGSSIDNDQFSLKSGFFSNEFKDNDSLTTLDIPGAVTSTDSLRSRDRRKRFKTLGSSWTQSVDDAKENMKLRNESYTGRRQRRIRKKSEDEVSSTVESDVENERKRSTSNPRNRPGAARPRRCRVGAISNTAEYSGEHKMDIHDYILSRLDADSLLAKPSTRSDENNQTRRKFELKVSVNPESSVCEIILPGSFLSEVVGDRQNELQKREPQPVAVKE